MAERLRAPDLSSGVSDQQSVGSSPGRDTCVLKQDIQTTMLRALSSICIDFRFHCFFVFLFMYLHCL